MRINSNTVIAGRSVTLVPYRDVHVPRYHVWMSSPELQKLTASEPLILEDEYKMQQSWLLDEDKCTFILLDKKVYDETCNELEAMIGDTNLFLTDPDDRTVAEVEIMIAEEPARGKGIGKEATLLMLRYGVEALGIRRYEAKIGMDNVVSISMFNKIGFCEISRSDVFREVTLSLDVDENFMKVLSTCTYLVQEYK